ncbi:MAG: universal stress protein, partial [Leifsonia sp.]
MNNSKDSRILVGVDGSDASIDALRRGAIIAKAFDSPLEVITTWQFPVMFDGAY